jgi:hypothetical protein
MKAKFDDSVEFRSYAPQPFNHEVKLPGIPSCHKILRTKLHKNLHIKLHKNH